MYLVKNISPQPNQTMRIILPNGNQCSLSISFLSMQLGWFITNLTYQDFVLNGVRISNNPNILYPWKNILNWGLACFSSENIEPTQQFSFSSGASNLYVLDSTEVQALTLLYENGGAS